MNPKVLNGNAGDFAILQYQGFERFGILSKMLPATKIVMLGVEPVRLGIHLPIKPYETFTHLDKTFLFLDSPEKMPELPPAQKGRIVTVLQSIFGNQ